MLSSLRKIRGDLLAQPKTKKFLLYAVGEVLLVTAGILIALQINNWNEERKDSVREYAYLEQLYADSETNASRIAQVAEHHAKLAEDLMFAVSVVKRGKLAADEVERFKWAILRMYQFYPPFVTTGGYDSLIASGDFAILQDQELKTSLAKAHGDLEVLPRFSNAASEQRGLPDAVWESAVMAVSHPGGKGILWRVDFEILKNYPGTLGILANQRFSHEVLRDFYKLVADEFAELHDLIGQLLEKVNAPNSE